MVVEARKDAETVWYNIVWEEVKDASNVVDYDIHSEVTVDTSSVLNANNDTTTGMATVIPWVNAPKLIAETSIVGEVWWWAKIVEISDYLSVSEWQPVVDRVLGWEFVCVHCKFTEYSVLQTFYFEPFYYLENSVLRFGAIYPWGHRFRINCWVTWTTVTSIWTAHWSWNTEA